MSLKNFAFLALRARGYTPKYSLELINTAIRSSVNTGLDFEICINLGQELHGKNPVF